VVFVGSHGYGPAYYGKGTADLSRVGTIDRTDGGLWVYDPTGSAKGTHAYPYRVQMLGSHVDDLAAAALGNWKYNALWPRFWHPIDLPYFNHEHYPPPPAGTIPRHLVTGAEFDAERCELHVCVQGQDSYGWDPGPLWHVVKVDGIEPRPNPVLRLGETTLVSVPAPQPAPSPSLEDRVAALEAEVKALTDRLSALLAALKAALQ
jgi:hypothetical protein